jgi:hypothetical protein
MWKRGGGEGARQLIERGRRGDSGSVDADRATYLCTYPDISIKVWIDFFIVMPILHIR